MAEQYQRVLTGWYWLESSFCVPISHVGHNTEIVLAYSSDTPRATGTRFWYMSTDRSPGQAWNSGAGGVVYVELDKFKPASTAKLMWECSLERLKIIKPNIIPREPRWPTA